MRLLSAFATMIAFIMLSGCAHQIEITPNIGKIDRDLRVQPKIKQNVGYVIPDSVMGLEITTPGGGGDKVRYFPYRDIEAGLFKMFSNVFGSVTKLKSAGDSQAIAANNIDYVITTEISTNSSSPSPFTWPPTQFSVDLTCTVKDPSGVLIDTKKVIGEGHAEFGEFKSDHGLAGKRASEDALLKMQIRLLEFDSSVTKPKITASAGTPNQTDIIKDLEKIKSLFDRGVLSPSEYESKRKQLVDKL